MWQAEKVQMFREVGFPDELIAGVVAPGKSLSHRQARELLDRVEAPVRLGRKQRDAAARREAAYALRRFAAAEDAAIGRRGRVEKGGRLAEDDPRWLDLEVARLEAWSDAITADERTGMLTVPRGANAHELIAARIAELRARAETISASEREAALRAARERFPTTAALSRISPDSREYADAALAHVAPDKRAAIEAVLAETLEKPSAGDILGRLPVPARDDLGEPAQ